MSGLGIFLLTHVDFTKENKPLGSHHIAYVVWVFYVKYIVGLTCPF